MTIVLKNNVSSTLTTPISASDTGLAVADGDQFPSLTGAEYFYATLMSPAGTTEIIKVTARAGNALTVVRAQDGTSAAGFAAGALVEMRVTAASILDAAAAFDSADEISITDAGGYYTATDVEGALQEAAQAGTTQITDAGGYYTATDVEGALQEAAQAGTTQITDAGGYYTATDVEGALQEAAQAQAAAHAWRTINVSTPGEDNVVANAVGDTLNLAAGPNIELTTVAGTKTVTIGWLPEGEAAANVFATKAEAEAYSFATVADAPDTIFLGGFGYAGEFGYAKAYTKYSGTPLHGGSVAIPTDDASIVYYQPDVSDWVTPRMYGSGVNDTSTYALGTNDDGMDGVLDALTYGNRVDLGKHQTFVGYKTYNVVGKGTLQVKGENIRFFPKTIGPTARNVGTKGAFLWFLNIEHLDWDVDCDMFLDAQDGAAGRYSSGLITRATSAGSTISIKRTRVYNPNYNSQGEWSTDIDQYSSALVWCAVGIGCEGWYSAGGPFEYQSLHIEDCEVHNVVRYIDPSGVDPQGWGVPDGSGVYAAMTTGIWMGEAFKTRLINTKVNGVFLGNTANIAPASAKDADCVVYKTRLVGGYSYSGALSAYYPGEFIMEGCDIRNGQGRWVKTQAAGQMTIRNNVFAIDRTTSGGLFYMIQAYGGAWYGLDCQDEPAIIENNQFLIKVQIVNQVGANLVGLRAGASGVGPLNPGNNPGYNPNTPNSRDLFGAFRDNYVFAHVGTTFVNPAQVLTAIAYVDNTYMVAAATANASDFRNFAVDLSGNTVVSGLGYSNAFGTGASTCVAKAFYLPNLTDFTGTAAVLRLFMNYNDLDTNLFVDASGSGGADHTGQYLVVVKDNATHTTAAGGTAFTFGSGPSTSNILNARQNS